MKFIKRNFNTIFMILVMIFIATITMFVTVNKIQTFELTLLFAVACIIMYLIIIIMSTIKIDQE